MVPAAPVAPAAAAATKKTTVVLMRVALPRDEDDDDMEDFKGKRLLFVRLFAWTVRPEFFLGGFFVEITMRFRLLLLLLLLLPGEVCGGWRISMAGIWGVISESGK